jgi:hypothetical protein
LRPRRDWRYMSHWDRNALDPNDFGLIQTKIMKAIDPKV